MLGQPAGIRFNAAWGRPRWVRLGVFSPLLAITTEGFALLKGSRGRLENVASIQGTSHERFREKLLTEGILTLECGGVVFTRDYLFSSPSMAAVALQGRSANGWFKWKDTSGKTLDEANRQTVQSTG